jgi:hypothetical protein
VSAQDRHKPLPSHSKLVDEQREWTIYVCPSSGSPYSCGCDREHDEDCQEIEIVVVRREERDRFREALGVLAGLSSPETMTRYRRRLDERRAVRKALSR